MRNKDVPFCVFRYGSVADKVLIPLRGPLAFGLSIAQLKPECGGEPLEMGKTDISEIEGEYFRFYFDSVEAWKRFVKAIQMIDYVVPEIIKEKESKKNE